jgi:hypothetical protein
MVGQDFSATMLSVAPPLVQRAYQDVLGVSLEPMRNEEWSIVDRLVLPCQHALNVGLGNEEWRGLLVLAFDDASFGMVPGGAGDLGLARDALGEVLNTVGGFFAAEPSFHAYLGELLQAPPMYFNSEVTYPKAKSLSGVLRHGSMEMFFGWALLPAISPLMRKALERLGKI